ncbi:hypothetical protein pah_c047o033 [Parachlamydia acanthamoebae str. Hall's coccus]|nr:hypothetical protein pah_c047o033 [Parachlamydia acanthamoebae str. Hall's coccus]
MHLDLRLIPCYKEDMDDPRGGVRGGYSTKTKIGTLRCINWLFLIAMVF